MVLLFVLLLGTQVINCWRPTNLFFSQPACTGQSRAAQHDGRRAQRSGRRIFSLLCPKSRDGGTLEHSSLFETSHVSEPSPRRSLLGRPGLVETALLQQATPRVSQSHPRPHRATEAVAPNCAVYNQGSIINCLTLAEGVVKTERTGETRKIC